MTLKKYLIYYLDIMPTIYFLINYQPFILYMAYILVRRYLTNNPGYNNIDNNKIKQIYEIIYTINW